MHIFEQLESSIRGYCRLYPTVFKTASNARQVDETGKSYIDFFAGAGVLNFGHNNEHMKQALIDFINQNGIAHSLDMYTTVKRDFLQKFSDTILQPRGMEYKMQFVGPTGTNAVEAALKLARRVTGRTTVVAYSHGFHGMTLGSLACTANSAYRNAAGIPLEYVLRQPYGCAAGCEGCDPKFGVEWVERLASQFADSSSGLEPPAAFLVEVIQAEGGVHIGDVSWLQSVRQLARELGALFIIDDIQAGCGRTGSYFSFDSMDLDPDIINLAKGIGGFGTPLAMNLVKPEHDERWKPGEHTGTFRGQGFSFVAGTEALKYFDNDQLMQEVKSKGEKMQTHLKTMCSKHGDMPFHTRGRGMMQAIDMGNGDRARAVAEQCFKTGLLIGACGTGGRVLKLIPPLTTPEADLHEGLAILNEAINSVVEKK